MSGCRENGKGKSPGGIVRVGKKYEGEYYQGENDPYTLTVSPE